MRRFQPFARSGNIGRVANEPPPLIIPKKSEGQERSNPDFPSTYLGRCGPWPVGSPRGSGGSAQKRLSQSHRSRSTHLFVGAYRGIDRKTTLTCSKVCARPAGARGEHTRPRSAYSRRQPHLSEQAGDARELIRGWRSCEPRHCAGGRAAARTDKRQLKMLNNVKQRFPLCVNWLTYPMRNVCHAPSADPTRNRAKGSIDKD